MAREPGKGHLLVTARGGVDAAGIAFATASRQFGRTG
jgi:hypothetical protein